MVSPACVAWTVQVPPVSRVSIAPGIAPDTVQTDSVVDVKLTVRPEDAVALTVNGAVPSALFESAPKAMVWLVCATVIETVLLLEAAVAEPPP